MCAWWDLYGTALAHLIAAYVIDLDYLHYTDRYLSDVWITLSAPSIVNSPAQEAGSPPQQVLGTGERKIAGERRQSGNNHTARTHPTRLRWHSTI